MRESWSPAARPSSSREAFAAMPEVDRVVGNADKTQHACAAMTSCRRAGRLPRPRHGASSRSRTAAIIAAPSARSGRRAGRAARCRSRPFATRSQRELDRGAKEIVLTGVDITSYDGRLGSATCASACLPPCPASSGCGFRRSTASRSTTPLFELIAGEPRLMPHFHLSLQAGDDMILKRMKRRHSRAEAVAHDRTDQDCAARCHDRRRPDRRLSHRN